MGMTKKRRSHHKQKPLIADTSDSACFDDLRYANGQVFATFSKDGSQYSYPMSRQDAKEWFDSDLGRYFNENVR